MRSEVEVAADTVLALRLAGYLTNVQITGAARIAGVTMQDLADSHARYQRQGNRNPQPLRNADKRGPIHPQPKPAAAQPVLPDPRPTPAPEPVLPPADKSVPDSQQRRDRKEIDGVIHMLCKGCGEWLPTDQFLMRSDRPGIRVSRCSPCRRTYQRERRVTAKVLDDLQTIGVSFVLDKDSNILGVQCSVCELPFESGQIVHGDTSLHHESCS